MKTSNYFRRLALNEMRITKDVYLRGDLLMAVTHIVHEERKEEEG